MKFAGISEGQRSGSTLTPNGLVDAFRNPKLGDRWRLKAEPLVAQSAHLGTSPNSTAYPSDLVPLWYLWIFGDLTRKRKPLNSSMKSGVVWVREGAPINRVWK